MQYLFVASGGLTLFIIALILGKKNKNLSDRILLVWLFIFAANLISLFVLYRATEPFNSWEQLILEFSEVSIFAHGPILWVYTLSLTIENFRLQEKHVYHLIPFCLGYLFFLTHILSYSEVDSLARNTITILKMGSLLVYLILVIVRLNRHGKHVEHIFSNVEEKHLSWLTFLSWSILVIWAIAGSSLLIDRLTVIVIPQYGGIIAHVAICIFIFLMGYFGLNQPSIFVGQQSHAAIGVLDDKEELKRVTEEYLKYGKSGLDTKQSRQIQSDLSKLMKTDKPYLEKELTLYNLARMLGVQPNHLSQVINSMEGQNFFDYINMHRVEAAKDKILSLEFQNLTLLGIAFECGFNSKASFNRAFKKFTGQTPTEFKKN
ncbi:MAG: AraC family transcriptional regulator [Maribacter sp.]|nr:AraC family transcriptional regulator [Maribacter sp.]